MNNLTAFLAIGGSVVAFLTSTLALFLMFRGAIVNARKEAAAEKAAKAKEVADKLAAEEKARDELAERERVANAAGITLEELRQQVARELLEDLREQVATAGRVAANADARAQKAEERADAADDRMDKMGSELRALRSSYAKAERQIGEMFDHLDAVEIQLATPPPRPAHWIHFEAPSL